MAISIIHQGYVNTEGNPYTVIDLMQPIGNDEEGIGWLKSIDGGSSTNGLGASSTVRDGAVYINVPSPFKSTSGLVNSTAAMISDFGFMMGSDKFSGALQYMEIEAGSAVIKGGYSRVAPPTKGAVGIALNQKSLDLSCYTKNIMYASGSYVESIGKADGDNVEAYAFYAFFDNKGGCHFFFSLRGNGSVAQLCSMPPNSINVRFIGNLEPLRKYYLTDAAANISGSVFDSAGLPAANRVVSAYDRRTLHHVGNTISLPDGTYSMPVASKTGNSVFVVCLDDDAPPDFEAQIIDRISII